MLCGVKMLCGMLVFGIITAAYMAAGKTESQMYPGISCLQTVLTPLWSGWLGVYIGLSYMQAGHSIYSNDLSVMKQEEKREELTF